MWFRRHKTSSLLVALFLLIGVALPVSAQGEDPYIVAWIDGATVLGAEFDQGITGQDYVVGETVELYLRGERVGEAIAEPNEEGTGTPSFEVPFEPGDEIGLVRSDSTERILIAHDLGISETSSAADTVSGWADSSSEVRVVGLASGVQQIVSADTQGMWTADFAPSYDLMTGDIVAALQSDEDGDMTGVFASVEGEPITPPEKASFHESYKLPEDRDLVPDPGWLNVGCTDVVYEMVSGKFDAKYKAKFVGVDESTGDWLYQMTQDFDWKNAVFESYDDNGPTGDFFDVESIGEMDAVVRVVDQTQPIWPGNIEPVDGEVETYFFIYDQVTGDLADWIVVEGTFENGVTMEGTCNG